MALVQSRAQMVPTGLRSPSTLANNSIVSLKELPFSCRSYKDKLAIKLLEPPRPNLIIKQVWKMAGNTYFRGFSMTWYLRKSWLAGCEVTNALFCYPCLLIHPGTNTDGAWTKTGVADMHQLSERVRKRRCISIGAWNSRHSRERWRRNAAG